MTKQDAVIDTDISAYITWGNGELALCNEHHCAQWDEARLRCMHMDPDHGYNWCAPYYIAELHRLKQQIEDIRQSLLKVTPE